MNSDYGRLDRRAFIAPGRADAGKDAVARMAEALVGSIIGKESGMPDTYVGAGHARRSVSLAGFQGQLALSH